MMSWPFVGSRKPLKSTATHDLFLSIFFPPFLHFFLALSLSCSLLPHNRSPFFMGLIRQSPPTGLLYFGRHFIRNACPCLNVLIVLMDAPPTRPPILCAAGLLNSKKFQNTEGNLPCIQHSAHSRTAVCDWRHIATERVYSRGPATRRISASLLPTLGARVECNLPNKCCDRQLVWRVLLPVCALLVCGILRL